MYLFFDNVPSYPTAEILKLKLQSPSYPGAARTETGLTTLFYDVGSSGYSSAEKDIETRDGTVIIGGLKVSSELYIISNNIILN